MNRRGIPLSVGTLNFSWEANAHNQKKGNENFSGRDYKSANAILKAEPLPSVVLVQEMSVNKLNFADKNTIPLGVEKLFRKAYKCVAHRFIEVEDTWFGSMVLVSTSLTDTSSTNQRYSFVDLSETDDVSKSCYSDFHQIPDWPFSLKGGRLLAVAMMVDNKQPDDKKFPGQVREAQKKKPIMILCSAHSAHQIQWNNLNTTWIVNTVVNATIRAYNTITQSKSDFTECGIVFGGDLNTTKDKNRCDWGGKTVKLTVEEKEVKLYKLSGKNANFKTLRKEKNDYPRDWIFSTQGNPKYEGVYSETGSDHYLVMAQTMMRAPSDDTMSLMPFSQPKT